jgi:hypothetical protein
VVGQAFQLTFPVTTAPGLLFAHAIAAPANTTNIYITGFTCSTDGATSQLVPNAAPAVILGHLAGNAAPNPGTVNITYGATLAYPASVTSDTYTATYNIVAAYQ